MRSINPKSVEVNNPKPAVFYFVLGQRLEDQRRYGEAEICSNLSCDESWVAATQSEFQTCLARSLGARTGFVAASSGLITGITVSLSRRIASRPG